jgi:predicted TIM-barrel fold metal-dependent hydrolase
MRRRDFVQLLSFLPAAVWAGRPALSQIASNSAATHRLIDIHAHVFNSTDLPARRFLKIVFLHKHPEQGTESLLALGNNDVLDWLIELFIRITSGRAPDARTEIAMLDGLGLADNAARDFKAASEITIDRVAEFLREPPPSPSSLERQPGSAAGAAALKGAVLRAGGVRHEDFSAASTETQAAARNAFNSNFDVGVYLRWFTLFTMYRHALVDQLADYHKRQGYEPILLAPALIDYSKWLGEEVASSLMDQVQVMGRISRRPEGPAVHGYVCYDPLREVFHRRFNELGPAPLQIVRTAIIEHGFLGVKLYPPMGFRPTGNGQGQQYPREVIEKLNQRVSADLNRAMDDLFALCTNLSASIIAHTAESNAAGPGYARRADPAHWLPALRKYPSLRLAFAHFGRFSYVSVGAPRNSKLPESSWEWTFGRTIAEDRSKPLFADLSYFSEVLEEGNAAKRRLMSQTMRRFVRTFDPDVRHILFGTDWLMLGVESRHDLYPEVLAKFLRDDCGFDADAMGRVFHGNAIRFLGLGRGEPARDRLASFYNDHNLNGNRLAVFDES